MSTSNTFAITSKKPPSWVELDLLPVSWEEGTVHHIVRSSGQYQGYLHSL